MANLLINFKQCFEGTVMRSNEKENVILALYDKKWDLIMQRSGRVAFENHLGAGIDLKLY